MYLQQAMYLHLSRPFWNAYSDHLDDVHLLLDGSHGRYNCKYAESHENDYRI